MTITLKYSCRECGLKDVEVSVSVRGRENVTQWLEGVALPVLTNDHYTRSPRCIATSLADVKIPIPPGENARIGDPTEH